MIQLIRPLGKPAKWKQCTIWRAATAPWKEVKSEINELILFNKSPQGPSHNCLSKLQAIWTANYIGSQSYPRRPSILTHSLPPLLLFVIPLSSLQLLRLYENIKKKNLAIFLTSQTSKNVFRIISRITNKQQKIATFSGIVFRHKIYYAETNRPKWHHKLTQW